MSATDRRDWQPVDPARRIISMSGGSETDFVIGDRHVLCFTRR